MGSRQQELQASCILTLEIARRHAGILRPDVEYGARLIEAAPYLLEACEQVVHFSRLATSSKFEGIRYRSKIAARAQAQAIGAAKEALSFFAHIANKPNPEGDPQDARS